MARSSKPPEAIREALAMAVASRQVPDDVVRGVAKRLADLPQLPARIDVCSRGICIDVFHRGDDDWTAPLKAFSDRYWSERIRKIDLFPWGIPFPDLLQMRVQLQFDELAPFMDATVGGPRG